MGPTVEAVAHAVSAPTARLVADLAELLGSATPVGLDRFGELMDAWLTLCDRSETVVAETKYNTMHVVALGLCALLQSTELPEYEDFSLEACLGKHAAGVLLCEQPVCGMSWRQLSDTLTALQLHFKQTITWDSKSGYHTVVDYASIFMELLKRVGYWLGRQWRHAVEEPADQEALLGLVDLDKEGWRCVRPACVVEVFDGVHALLSLTRLLMKAQVLSLHTQAAVDTDSVSDEIKLFNHHREASIDDFYEMSMVADCAPGAITQYKHKFQFLFHSISQVVYYHYPTYERQRQQPLPMLSEYAAPGVNLLPLLLQVNLDMPHFYEHTGAGLHSAFSAHAFSWVLVSGYILLVDRSGAVFCAEDLRSLLLFTLKLPSTETLSL